MKKYLIEETYSITYSVPIEADSEEKAEEIAEDIPFESREITSSTCILYECKELN